MAGRATVSGFRLKEQTVEISGAEGLSIKEVASQLGVDMGGRVWIVNGKRLSDTEVGSARVKDKDVVQTGSKSSQGAH